VPWALRDPEDARALLAAAAAEGMPQGRVERLALLHLLMRMHREAHARTGVNMDKSTFLSIAIGAHMLGVTHPAACWTSLAPA
jgi:hypothetical protein